MKPETIAIHVPNKRRDGAIAAPIHLSTTYEHGPANESLWGYEYIRGGNPNVDDLEARLSALEGGAGAVAFASGMAAGAAFLSAMPAGTRILFHNDLYIDFRHLARETLPQWGLRAVFVDCRDEAALAAALKDGAGLIWIETPSNPQLDIIDIAKVARLAHEASAKLMVDASFATPALQNPFLFGADAIMHSVTKYMGGHSDMQGGALVMREDEEMLEALTRKRTLTGGVLAPFNAWMVARGLQTLHCRMERHSANALELARMLKGHPGVERVRYPFLESDPGYALARKQMRAGGGMVSFEARGGREGALKAASKVKLFVNATSFGGVESLIEHRASVEGAVSPTPEGLLRLSVGLENVDDLTADLDQALRGA